MGGDPVYIDYDGWIAIQVAIADINTRHDILPGHQLLGVYSDDQDDTSKAFFSALSLGSICNASNSVDVIIGGTYTSTTISLATVTNQLRIPLISWAGTSTVLSDKTLYPTVTRVVPSNGEIGAAAVHLIKSYGWNHIGIIHSDTVYSTSIVNALLSVAEQYNVTILTTQSYSQGFEQQDINVQMNGLVKSGAKIIFLASQTFGDATAVLQVADQYGLISPDHVWIGTNGWFSGFVVPSIYKVGNQSQHLFSGIISIMPYVDQNSTRFNHLRSLWPKSNLTYLDEWSAYAYDDTYLAAYGFHEQQRLQAFCSNQPVNTIMPGTLNFTKQHCQDTLLMDRTAQLMYIMKMVSFDGASGYVSFDANGDRRGSVLILNAQNNTDGDPTLPIKLVPIGVIGSNSRVIKTVDTIFRSGSKIPPLDLQPQIILPIFELSRSIQLSVWIISAIGFWFILMTFIGTIHYRNTVIFKASSVPFCLWMLFFNGVLTVGSIWYALSPSRGDNVCDARIWFAALPLVGLLSCLLVKTNRIRTIFTSEELFKPALTNGRLLPIVTIIIIAEITLLVALTCTNLTQPRLDIGTKVTQGYQVYSCTSVESDGYIIWLVFQLTFIGIFLFAGTYMAFSVRHVPSAFNESSTIVNALYLLILLSGVLLPLNFIVGENPNALAVLRGIGQTLTAISMTLALFGPKFYYIFDGQGNDPAMKDTFAATRQPPNGNKILTKATRSSMSIDGTGNINQTAPRGSIASVPPASIGKAQV